MLACVGHVGVLAAACVVIGALGCGDNVDELCESLPAGNAIAEAKLASGLIADGGVLYWHDGTRIYRLPPNGVVEVVVDDAQGPRSLAIDDDELFWVTSNMSIRASNKTTRVTRTIYPGQECTNSDGCVAHLVADDSYLYLWETETHQVQRIDKQAGSAAALGRSTWGGHASDGNYVYWTNVAPAEEGTLVPLRLEIVRTPASGGVPESVADLGDRIPTTMRSTATHIVVGTWERDGGRPGVFAVPTTGGAATLVTDDAFLFTVEGDALVFADSDSPEPHLIMEASVLTADSETLACARLAPGDIVSSPSTIYWIDPRGLVALPR